MIHQLVDPFKEVLTNEYVLDERILDNILCKFISQLPKNLQKQLISGFELIFKRKCAEL